MHKSVRRAARAAVDIETFTPYRLAYVKQQHLATDSFLAWLQALGFEASWDFLIQAPTILASHHKAI